MFNQLNIFLYDIDNYPLRMKNHMNSEELLKNKKHLLQNITEVQKQHSMLLEQHLQPIQIEKTDKDFYLQTAFPTPNNLYQQEKINTKSKRNID